VKIFQIHEFDSALRSVVTRMMVIIAAEFHIQRCYLRSATIVGIDVAMIVAKVAIDYRLDIIAIVKAIGLRCVVYNKNVGVVGSGFHKI